MDIIVPLITSSPYMLILILAYFKLDKRPTRIETDIAWLKKELPACRPTLDDHTH